MAAQAVPRPSQERVTFQNAAGLTLVGILLDTGSTDVAILCHGLYDNKDAFHLPRLADALAAKGLSSLRMDFTGNGESQGTFRYGNMSAEAEDIRAAVLFLQGRGKRIQALLGHSKGGTSVVLYAAKYDDIPRVVNVAGRFDYSRGYKERFGDDIMARLEAVGAVAQDTDGFKWELTLEDMQQRLATDMDAACRAIKQSRVLTIHGTEDATIPLEDAHSFAQRISQHDLIVIDGAGHSFRQPEHADRLVAEAVRFITSDH